MTLFQKFIRYFRRDKYPDHLYLRGRVKLPTTSFNNSDKLYRAYDLDDLEDNEKIKLETISFPSFSCNWGRFSKPNDLRFRRNSSDKEGCYSFNVATSRYNNIATPVHDPIPDSDIAPNYAHVEVRELWEGEDIYFEPPKQRKKKKTTKYRERKILYRDNLRSCLEIEIPAT